MPTRLDSNTSVQLGILITLISAAGGAAWWASGITRDVAAVRENSDTMTAATLRLEAIGREHAATLVGLTKDVELLDKRLGAVESKMQR